MTKWQDWDYATAAHRVGQTAEQQLDWLARFAASEGPIAGDAEGEVYAFVTIRGLHRMGYDPRTGKLTGAPTDIRLAPTVRDGDYEQIREELRRQLQSLRVEGRCAFDLPGVNLFWNNPHRHSRRASTAGGKPWHMTQFRAAQNIVGMFFGEVLDVLLELGDNLRLCPEQEGGCGRFFAARRPHQVYCDSRCTNRAGQARYRAAHPEATTTKRRERYAKKQRAKLGNVKVGRKPR